MGEGLERRVKKLEDAVGEPAALGQCQCKREFDVEAWKAAREKSAWEETSPGDVCKVCGKIIPGDLGEWLRWRVIAAQQRRHAEELDDVDCPDPNAV